jgi:uncharacterized protein (TIGR02265 family)
MELNKRLDEAIAEELSPRNTQRIFIEMGRASADLNLTGPQRSLVHVGDPHYLLSLTESVYGYYYSTGKRTYERTGPKSVVLTTFDAEEVTAADCLTVIGWHQRAVEICGGNSVQVEHPKCRARGEDRCDYHLSWQ